MSKEYAVDSTKGHSMINPLNYKGDVLVQVWVDSRVLATLCEWLDSKGVYPVYLSQVVRRPLEVLTDVLVNSGEVKLVDDTVEARTILQRRFKVDLSRGGRGTKNVMHNIELSIRRKDLNERVQREKGFNDVEKPLRENQNSAITAKVEEAKRVMRELFPDGEQTQDIRHFDYEQPKEDVKRVYDDSKIVVCGTENKILGIEEKEPTPLKLKSTPEEIRDRIEKADKEAQMKLDELNNFDPMSLMGSAVKEKIV